MRLSPLFILLLLFTMWQTSFAATVDDCSKIKTSDERLACFDNISKQNEHPVGDEQKSQWNIFTHHDEWNDNVHYGVTLLSDNQIDKGVNDNKYGLITIVCLKPSMVVAFSATDLSTYTNDLLNSDGDYEFVRYRLDKEQAKEMEMKLGKSQRTVGIASSEESILFIKEMFGHDKMLVEINRYGLGSTTLEFSINGLEAAIKPLRKACKW